LQANQTVISGKRKIKTRFSASTFSFLTQNIYK